MRALLALIFLIAASAHADFRVPSLSGPVVDEGRMLSPDARAKLERFLLRMKEAGGPQLQVATVENLGGLSIEEASIKITDQWKLGDAKTDRGILLLLSRDDRRVRIEVGQGLEGDLPDITASRIIREVIIPRFKSGEIDRGVIDGVLAITHYVYPQFLEGQNTAPVGARKTGGKINWIFVIFILLFFILPMFGGRGRRRSGLGGFLLGYGLGGGFGGRGGGGGGWGGGGGGFSGGGASGSW